MVYCAICRRVIADAVRAIRSVGTIAEATLEDTATTSMVLSSQCWLPSPDDVIGEKYIVQEKLGGGSMGWIVAARHRDIGLRVAVKILRPTKIASAPRLLAEAQIGAKLRHPNLREIFDYGHLQNGLPYIVMEYLTGHDLATFAAEGPLPVLDAVRYVRQACAGLSQAHAAGIVHRDLKPENLFLCRSYDGGSTVKVLDFGVCKVLDTSVWKVAAGATAAGIAVGSPLYMSPEQIRVRKELDVRSDIWSLGVILYQLTTGRVPFRAPGLAALSVSIVTDVPIPPSRRRKEIPPALNRIILRCLAKDPADRYPSVDELARELATVEATMLATRGSRRTIRKMTAVVVAIAATIAVIARGRMPLDRCRLFGSLRASGLPSLPISVKVRVRRRQRGQERSAPYSSRDRRFGLARAAARATFLRASDRRPSEK